MNISDLLNPERVKDSASNSRPYTPAPLIRSPTSDQSLLDAETDSPPDFDSPSIIPSAPTRSHPVLQRTNGKPSARSTRISALQREDDNIDDSSSLSSLDESDGEDRYAQPSDDDTGSEHSESEEELGPKRSSNSRGERATKRAKQAEIWSDEVEMQTSRDAWLSGVPSVCGETSRAVPVLHVQRHPLDSVQQCRCTRQRRRYVRVACGRRSPLPSQRLVRPAVHAGNRAQYQNRRESKLASDHAARSPSRSATKFSQGPARSRHEGDLRRMQHPDFLRFVFL